MSGKSRAQKGRAQGLRQSRIDIAKRLLERNMPLDDISYATGMTKKAIAKLAASAT